MIYIFAIIFKSFQMILYSYVGKVGKKENQLRYGLVMVDILNCNSFPSVYRVICRERKKK